MATSLQLSIFTFAILVACFYFGRVNASSAISPVSESSAQYFSDDVTNLLIDLRFEELAMAVPTLCGSYYTTCCGSSTRFAPDEASVLSLTASCSVTRLLREHIVPGLFCNDYLKKRTLGTKLQTMNRITITSAVCRTNVGGVDEVSRPDLYKPLCLFSCNVERMNSLSILYQSQYQYPSTAATPYCFVDENEGGGIEKQIREGGDHEEQKQEAAGKGEGGAGGNEDDKDEEEKDKEGQEEEEEGGSEGEEKEEEEEGGSEGEETDELEEEEEDITDETELEEEASELDDDEMGLNRDDQKFEEGYLGEDELEDDDYGLTDDDDDMNRKSIERKTGKTVRIRI